ncbi:hypothetical protein [Alkalihalobacillus deserti]|uniref:hypothetical protein n=1 Tax=Alkalihalobacillus deserti TaxID=2879466 RepID=UPI001D148470|nr:hypothetical protein [Alkalihalobacillus deserti]
MFKTIILYIASLFILYLVIKNAVKNGINRSKMGQFLEEKFQANKKAFILR